MVLRKINAVISLIITVLLLDHAIFLGAWMLSRGAIVPSAGFLPWILLGLMVVHALICIDFAISAHENAEKRKVNSYAKLNLPTMMQRMGGMLLLVFTALHVAGASGAMQPPQVIHAIVPPLFFALALSHAAISVSKAFITLGIGNAKTVKVVDIVAKVLCGATLIADVVGFYLYVC